MGYNDGGGWVYKLILVLSLEPGLEVVILA
jgi:hypothetical protein